jgi:hypothetical protein
MFMFRTACPAAHVGSPHTTWFGMTSGKHYIHEPLFPVAALVDFL